MAYIKSVGIGSRNKDYKLKSKAKDAPKFVSGPSGETITEGKKKELLAPATQKNVASRNIPSGMTPEARAEWEVPLADQAFLQQQIQAEQTGQQQAAMETTGASITPQLTTPTSIPQPEEVVTETEIAQQPLQPPLEAGPIAGVGAPFGVGPLEPEAAVREGAARFGEVPAFIEFRNELQQKGYLGEVAGSFIPRSVGELALDVAELALISNAFKSTTPVSKSVTAQSKQAVQRAIKGRKEFASQVNAQAQKVLTGNTDAATQAASGASPQTIINNYFGSAVKGGKGAYLPKVTIGAGGVNTASARTAGKALGGILSSTKGKVALGIGIGTFVISSISQVIGTVANLRMTQTIGVNEAGDANLGLSVLSSSTKKDYQNALRNGDYQEAAYLLANQDEIEELAREAREATYVNETLIESVAGGFGLAGYLKRVEPKIQASQLSISQNGDTMRRDWAKTMSRETQSYIETTGVR